MPTSVNVTNLKINELKESQYDTAVQQGVIGENEISILTDAEAGQVIQVATLPTASVDELGNIYQFVGTTDANYTHGYFYECVSDGETPATYSWVRIDVQPTNDYEDLSNKPQINGVTLSGNKTSAALGIKDTVQISVAGTTTVEGYSVPNPTDEEVTAIYNAVVAGNNVQVVDVNDVYYQVLQVDSVDGAINIKLLYFGELSLLYTLENDTVTVTGKKIGGGLPDQTGHSGKFLTTDGTNASWGYKLPKIRITSSSKDWLFMSSAGSLGVYVVNNGAPDSYTDDRITFDRDTGNIQFKRDCVIGWNGNMPKTVVTKNISSSNQGYNDNYLINVPTLTAGSMCVQVSSMPTAGSTYLGRVYQFIGTTDSTYTHGKFYECVSNGQATPTYSWTEVSMGGGLQNTATRTDSLTILGTATQKGYAVNIGVGSSITGDGHNSIVMGYNAGASAGSCIVLGTSAFASSPSGIAIGRESTSGANNAIQIGTKSNGGHTNSDANTFKVGNNNGNFEMMSADGTIPHARLTNAVQSTTVTIATTDWGSNTASVTVSGLTATSVVWVAPDNASQSAYTTAGVYASAQATDTLTFACTQTPTASLTINVVFC